MLYLIVATEVRGAEIDDGTKWSYDDNNGQVVLGRIYADSYEDALRKGSKEFYIKSQNIDAYELVD